MRTLFRRSALAVVAALVVAAVGLLLYGRFIEPRRIEVREVSLSLERAASGRSIRILHLTDFHLSPEVPLSFLRQACLKAVAEKPDLICLTGDYITDHLAQAGEYAETLRILSAAAPTFAVAGNHDGGIWARERGGYPTPDEVAGLLRRAGIRYLSNKVAEVEIGGKRVAIGGLGDLWAGYNRPEDIAQALENSAADLRLLLAHNPDAKETVRRLKWDILLAGHTHGGQLILPVVGAPFAPVHDKSMIKGLFEWEGRLVHVSPGVGNLHGMRLFSPPEISILRVAF
jgi:predicted MPP superfamily phosphohydrolase